jgi:hypothetical protein
MELLSAECAPVTLGVKPGSFSSKELLFKLIRFVSSLFMMKIWVFAGEGPPGTAFALTLNTISLPS